MSLPKPKIDRKAAMQLWMDERSDYAKEQVVLNNIGVVVIVMKTLGLNPSDEDLFSAGIVGLVKAVNTFNADKGVTFSAYATTVIRNEILLPFRKKQIKPALSLDETCGLDNGDEVSCAEVITDGKRFEEEAIIYAMQKEIAGTLTRRERSVILMLLDGKTQQEVAGIFGVTQSTISRILKSSRDKCKKILCIK